MSDADANGKAQNENSAARQHRVEERVRLMTIHHTSHLHGNVGAGAH